MAVAESSCCLEEQSSRTSKRISTLPNSPTAPQTTESSTDVTEQVRYRAYELYEQRGREDGHELDDWLQAESEIAHQGAKAVAG